MRTINEYKNRFNQLLEATIGNVKPLIMEENPPSGNEDITAGVLKSLSSLISGDTKAEEIFPTYKFTQPTKFEITMAQSLKQRLENTSTRKQTETLLNTAAEKIGGDDLKDDFEQLILTRYYDDEYNYKGVDIRQKSRKDGVDTENMSSYVKDDGSEFQTLDYDKIRGQVETSEKEVEELQNEMDQFFENMKKEIQAGKRNGIELGTNYRGKVTQLVTKINNLQKKYPQLLFNGFKVNQNYNDEILTNKLVDTLNDFLDASPEALSKVETPKLSFDYGELGYNPGYKN